MFLETCSEHNQIKDLICAKNQCNQLICKVCLIKHSIISSHDQAVKLCNDSKQYFLKWTQYLLIKLNYFLEIVTHMGYSKVFQMKLQTNHPKGTVSQLNFQEIQKITMQALQQHKKITQGNLTYIRGTLSLLDMIHPQFLKDLYNIVCQDAKFNLQNLSNNIQRKLIQSYPGKQIYKFSKFYILAKQIIQIEQERKKILRQYQDKIIVRITLNNTQLQQQSTSFKNQNMQNVQKNINNQYLHSKQDRFSKDYHSSSQKNIIESQGQQFHKANQGLKQNFISSSKLSQAKGQSKNIDDSENKLLTDKIIHYQQIIALLKSNQQMYKSKISTLSSQNQNLKHSLFNYESKLNSLNQSSRGPQQKIMQYLSSQQQQKLKSQILTLQSTQARLIEQNNQLNIALKDIQNIPQGRSRTINNLEQQIKKFTQNIQLKQKSIQQLNQLISNEQEQISYRQNQVQILQEEIKKLLNKIKSLEESIHQLNKLITNEQQEISYRQNQVQNLQQQIKKLLKRINQLQNTVKSLNSLIANQQEQITYRQNQSQILQKQVKKLLQKISYLQKSIRGLNNLIANEQEQIAYRQNQSQTLEEEVKKLVQKNKILQKSIHQLNNLIANEQQQIAYRQNQTQTLQKQVKNLVQRNKLLESRITILKQQLQKTKNNLKETSTSLSVSQKQTSVDQELVQQVVLLESDLQNKNDDIQLLISIVQSYILKILNNQNQKPEQGANIMNKLKNLRTLKFQTKNK